MPYATVRTAAYARGISSTLFRTKKESIGISLFWWEEVDSFNSETGKFTCISGASAPKRWFRRNAPRGVNRAESTIPSIKKDTALRCLFFGGKRWIRTTEGGANRFTVCSLWPLGNLPTLGAGGRSRTNNLLITNQLLCH